MKVDNKFNKRVAKISRRDLILLMIVFLVSICLFFIIAYRYRAEKIYKKCYNNNFGYDNGNCPRNYGLTGDPFLDGTLP